MRAKIGERKRENFSDLIVRDAGQTDATSTSERLQPGRNVYTVTKKVTPLDHDVTNMDADAEVDVTVK